MVAAYFHSYRQNNQSRSRLVAVTIDDSALNWIACPVASDVVDVVAESEAICPIWAMSLASNVDWKMFADFLTFSSNSPAGPSIVACVFVILCRKSIFFILKFEDLKKKMIQMKSQGFTWNLAIVPNVLRVHPCVVSVLAIRSLKRGFLVSIVPLLVGVEVVEFLA